MNKGVVIHLDNDVKILDDSKNLYGNMGIDLTYICCKNKEEFDAEMTANISNVKCVIFDLLSSEPTGEELNINPEFLEYINSTFIAYNIPIFIYSGYLPAIEGQFEENGNVFKVDKENGIEGIFEDIKVFFNSGFLDIFCPGGILETELHTQLHNSFTKQFRGNEIKNVISTIANAYQAEDIKARTKNVFKRIIVKSLMSDLISPVVESNERVNAIEHFYRRNSDVVVWTGDIWKKKDISETVIILTPRCDLANSGNRKIIYCNIRSITPSLPNKKEERIKEINKYLTDNLQGKSTRYIPDTPFLKGGGMVELSNHTTILIEDFKKEFNYHITLSDDLTNEIIVKFAYYFLRTGITTISPEEFDSYIELIKQKN